METPLSPAASRTEVDDDELFQVMADFLAEGYADTIASLCRREPRCLAWTGRLLTDERFATRLGVSILFEELVETSPELLPAAIPGLIEQLGHAQPTIRGEAASVLAIIGTPEALTPLPPLRDDPSPQVAALVRDILDSADG
ncbi:MAG: HEAT repeat domain-containing protein [Desulfobulbus sp.]